MSRQSFQMSLDRETSGKNGRKKGVRMGPFPLFLLALVVVSAISVIVILSVFYVQQGAQISRLESEIAEANKTTPRPVPPGVTTTFLPPTASPLWTSYRLPTSLIPEHYEVYLQVFLPFDDEEANRTHAFTTSGSVKINFTCAAATEVIVIHAWNMTFLTWSLVQDGNRIGVRRPVEDPLRHLLIFKADQALEAGKNYVLEIHFEGLIVEENQGFYRGFYMVNNKKRWLASTQFQPYKARRAFPCFDEPSFRATFDLTLKHDGRHTGTFGIRRGASRANVSTSGGVTWTETIFERSQRMPSYLLAFMVSDFARNSSSMPGNTSHEFGVISRPDAIGDAEYSKEVGMEQLTYAGELFDMDYFRYNNKLDMAAVPDFDAGAMENWGLIIYREALMLYRQGVSSAEDKKQITRVVAHELAHQWFGNAVTCSWWSESFLNEGFATFLEYPLTERVRPSWNMNTLFTAIETRTAYDTDSYESSIPLYREVNTQAEISDMFGRITYQKGGAVLRMIEGVMGGSVMYDSLKTYLTERSQTGITTYQDLLRTFTRFVNNVDMLERFEKWIIQSGFPLVTITVQGRDITAHQVRFLLGNDSEASLAQIWNVPISFVTDLHPDPTTDLVRDEQRQPKFWLTAKEEKKVGIIQRDGYKWVLANVEHYGYYRVNYDQKNWEALIAQLNSDHERISVHSRAQLIDDAFNLARKGILNYTVPFAVIDYLADNEDEYPPWLTTLDNFVYIDSMMGEDPVLLTYMSDLLRKQYRSTFWNTSEVWQDNANENYQELMRRSLLIERACYYGLPECTENARMLFDEWERLASTSSFRINPHIKDQIFCYGIRQGGDSDFDFLMEQYQSSPLSAVKLSLLRGAACSDDNRTLSRLLNSTLDDLIVRSQDAVYVFRYIVKFPLGVELAWEFLKTHWAELEKTLSRNDMITSVATKFKTPQKLAEVESFYHSQGPDSQEKLAFEGAIAKIKSNMQWIASYRSSVLAAMDSSPG